MQHSNNSLVTKKSTCNEEMSSCFTLRRYRGGDETAIVALLKSAFRDWHSLNYWLWMYKKNPAGEPIIWIAHEGKTIIGHYAMIPVRMKVADENLTGSQGVNAATHPSYQGQGVFSSIAARCIDDACIHNIPLTFGFSRKGIEPILKRHARRVHICYMVSMVKVLNLKPLLAQYAPSDILIQPANFLLRNLARSESVSVQEKEDLEIQRISRFDGRVTRFWNAISRSFQIIVIRDQEYLNWRYVDNPESNYVIFVASQNERILGYCVLKEEHQRDRTLGHVVDILGLQNGRRVVSSLIQTAVEYFRKRDVDLVLCMISEANRYKAAFMEAGFVQSPFRRMTLTCTRNLPADAGIGRATSGQVVTISRNSFLREKRNWFMMFGDSNWI